MSGAEHRALERSLGEHWKQTTSAIFEHQSKANHTWERKDCVMSLNHLQTASALGSVSSHVVVERISGISGAPK